MSIVYPECNRRVNRKSLFSIFVSLLITFCFLLLTTHFSLVHSISPLEQAQNDYSFQLTKLSEAHEKFITAKSSYLSYKTAIAKNEAFSKTKDYYIQIHKVYLSYLFLVEEKTNIFDWSLSSFKKDDFITQLKKETDYVNKNLSQAQATQTLEEIQAKSIFLDEHIKTTTLPIVAKTLTTSEIAQVEDSLGTFNFLSQKIDISIKARINDSNQSFYQNWKSEVENIKSQLTLQISGSKVSQGDSNINYFSLTNQTPIKIFKQNSQKTLERAINILYEILNII